MKIIIIIIIKKATTTKNGFCLSLQKRRTKEKQVGRDSTDLGCLINHGARVKLIGKYPTRGNQRNKLPLTYSLPEYPNQITDHKMKQYLCFLFRMKIGKRI